VASVTAVPTTILLVRHGETDWNRDNRFQGRADPPLNDTGRSQARGLASQLAAEPVGSIYSSPLRRAHETAEILAGAFGLDPNPSPALMEVDVGSWSGLTRAEVEARYPEGYRRWLEWHTGWDDGETYEELGLRVVAGLHELAGRHPGERVLVVTHGGPIRSAIAASLGVAFVEARREIGIVDNCTVVELSIRDGVLERLR
jgi:uncharacterized phosphatase